MLNRCDEALFPSTTKSVLEYLSSDFNRHPTAHLTAELFELHDRTGFAVYAYSIGPNDGSDIRQRLENAFDVFIDCEGRSDLDVARAIADAQIDILIDLNGFTRGARTNIFAYRPAPVQVNYLGYPGTMAASFIDYIIGDSTVFAASDAGFYSEKLVMLPHSYQPNDRKRLIAPDLLSRADCGLPADGFVFCCFNNVYKILPDRFGSWMRILAAVEGSVLWLLADNSTVIENLRHEAQVRGIDPSRLVFAERQSRPST